MVSYYNSLAMFPHQSRPAPPPGNASTTLYPSAAYHHAYNNYPATPTDQNSNLQLYTGVPQFDFAAHGTTPSAPAAWPHQPWSTSFPASCRSTYDWAESTHLPPPNQSPEARPTSEGGVTSPASPSYTSAGGQEGGQRSPAPSDQFSHVPLTSQYNARVITPPPHQYKANNTYS